MMVGVRTDPHSHTKLTAHGSAINSCHLCTDLVGLQHTGAAHCHVNCTAHELDKPADSHHPICLVARSWPLPVQAKMSHLNSHVPELHRIQPELRFAFVRFNVMVLLL